MKNKILIILIIAILVTITSFYKPSKVYAVETITSNCFVDIKGSIISPGVYEIEVRKGEDSKCLNYCSCNKQCPYYLMNYDKDIKDISMSFNE